MTKLTKFIVVCVAFLSLVTTTFAQKGVVAYRVRSCDYFLIYIEKSDDYVLAEWYGGYDPDKGDIVYGSFGSWGMKEVNYLREREGKLYIDDYGLDKDDALEKL